MSHPIRTVALVDWVWRGHHPTYFSKFASALSELGVKVLPLCVDPEDFSTLRGAFPSDLGCGENILPAQPIAFAPMPFLYPWRIRPVVQTVRSFAALGNRLRAWERENNSKIDLVFFACIYDWHFEWFRYAENFFRFPWSGLYLHARSFRIPDSPNPINKKMPCPEKIFTCSSMQSVALLDEASVAPMRALNGDKPTIAFPDFTDESLPQPGDPCDGLAQKVRSFAQGRPIISLVGHLQRTKGLCEFTKAALDKSLQDHVFFLAGELSWLGISKEKQISLMKAWEQSPNILTHLSRISSEAAINGVIASSDVVFAAYSDFPNSSNILTKAALFKRPVVVSDGYLMAERTRAYGLGEVIPEGDTAALIAAILRITANRNLIPQHRSCRANEYSREHSYDRLVEAFRELLELRQNA